ncbi:hypothetical protein EJ04DRAFT_438279 [Polyplosphaeria fusca]|uniref:Uncharacterized protein n=1 Tax=Polyplosphaeria fusca TaxID=682080 RepID=A0A9P4QZ30_9PLEO|nr:hypothetical protein EJ04DRAFT_438279 [Polyplosphaeria fusca]
MPTRSNNEQQTQEPKPSPPKRTLIWRDKFSPFPWRSFIIVSLLPLSLAPIIVLSTAAEEASVGYLSNRDCYPNGMWSEMPGATWRIMDSSYFFTPNLSFGSMTFTAVKVIDIAWDLIVGRGGQLLLAWVNYRVFNEWLVYHMEQHLTSYKMYTAVAFETTSMATLGVLGKEFLAFGERSWLKFFRWLGVLCMFLSTLYVLSFPTLMSAMTGYITTYEAYVEDYDKNLIELNKFKWVILAIEDSHRIGDYNKPLVATVDDPDLMDDIWQCERYNPDNRTDLSPLNPSASFPELQIWSQNVSSTWSLDNKTLDLESPTLSVAMYSYWNNATGASGMAPQNPYWRRGAYTDGGRQGDIYNASYVLTHGSCQPSETYQWGFSYIFLFMMAIFDFVWSCIMVGMWLDTRRGSRMYKSGRRPGLLRSIVDISEAMKEDFGQDADHLDEDELRRRLRDGGGALVVPKRELRIARTETGLDGARKRGRWKSMTHGSTF